MAPGIVGICYVDAVLIRLQHCFAGPWFPIPEWSTTHTPAQRNRHREALQYEYVLSALLEDNFTMLPRTA